MTLGEPRAPRNSLIDHEVFAPINPWRGIEIVRDPNMTERVLHARSPARAKRRAALGHPQHYREIPSRTAYHLGNRIIMHPALYDEMRRNRMENRRD